MVASLTLDSELVSWVHRVDELTTWLKSDMAAVMRQFPEQLSASNWFEQTHGRRVDATEAVPQWLKHQYGINTTTQPADHQDPESLSVAARMIGELLDDRANVLRAAPLYLLGSEEALQVAVTLAGTASYGQSMSWPTTASSATVLFPKPLSYQHITGDSEDETSNEGAAAMLDRIKPDGPAALEALTWFTTDGVVRCMDWIRPEVDSTGIGDVDEQIAQVMEGKKGSAPSRLPSLIYNGEWHRGVADAGSDVAAARQRIQTAAAQVAGGQAQRWDGNGGIADHTGLLVPSLAAVLADCVSSGFLAAVPRKVRGRRRSRRVVTLLREHAEQ